MGTSGKGNVFERLPAREGPPSALFKNSKYLASPSQELRPDSTGNTTVPESEMRREPQNSSIFYHASQEEVESLIILVDLILTARDSQSRKCIWENENPQTLLDFKAGKSTS